MEEKSNIPPAPIGFGEPEKMTSEQRNAVKNYLRSQIASLGSEIVHIQELLDIAKESKCDVDFDYWQNYLDWNEKEIKVCQDFLKLY